MSAPHLRCAIYTRVSSDQGLEQGFNSLDAQREAAEAYVKSQAHEGWRALREAFDDGGFSGGSLDRPALQRLLGLVRDGRVDVIVVYKVDRLTRSLSDFARLVELFDAHKVSFVSVTQSFNTTTSMGRLTLNVLLSFAQFEREVTGERIRDKIAASKKKGLWMGGVVPLGYRVEDRKLIVVEEEAALVQTIFERYLALGSIPALQRELTAQGITTRKRARSSGGTIGAGPLTNGPLSYILRNRHYLGEINHRKKSWPAEHAAIIDPKLFDAVQARLAKNLNRVSSAKGVSGALLIGKLFDDRGNVMSPSHAVKKGVRYRYYVSAPLAQGRAQEAGCVSRVPAEPLEAAIIAALKDSSTIGAGEGDAERIEKDRPSLRAVLDERVERIVLHRDRLEVRLNPAAAQSENRAAVITMPWRKPDAVRRREIIPPADAADAAHIRPIRMEERARLLAAIDQGRSWLKELIEGTIPDFAALARREDKSERSVRMTVSLAFLDPALVDAAQRGALPRGYGLSRLVDPPPAFIDQWAAIGLARPAE